ncbi:DUF3775 domain-containing protein [Azospirillum halopraeferens]|uniref:DUF3775 domain-containing protein n=1 Tax=Azospirillum halopraeferens TaxID=34010 RepID=UPI0004030A91|nr:DUF3775 domain-containing protein [Azospirillum halopraeferens]
MSDSAVLEDRTLEPPELNIGLKRLCYIISKARAYDAGMAPVDAEDEDLAEEEDLDRPEPGPEDPTLAELTGVLATLDDDEIVDVIALAWLGRGDFARDEWAEAVELARERHNDRSADYLIGIPNLGDCLEEGLDQIGLSTADNAFVRI